MLKLTLISALVVASALPGQVAATVGPSPAPLTSPIAISVANDTNASMFLSSPCPFHVRNSSGVVIYSPICIAIIININPGAVFTTYWNQHDDSNVQVPAGTYFVDVFLPGGMSTTSVTISATVEAGATPL